MSKIECPSIKPILFSGPMVRAISIRQPWAWFIAHGWKDIENRTWPFPVALIGKPVLIHAGKHFRPQEINDIFSEVKSAGLARSEPSCVTLAELKEQCGGIVGAAIFFGSVQGSNSPWASPEPGTWHWKIERAHPVKFHECKGKLNFFNVEYPHFARTAKPEGWPS